MVMSKLNPFRFHYHQTQRKIVFVMLWLVARAHLYKMIVAVNSGYVIA